MARAKLWRAAATALLITAIVAHGAYAAPISNVLEHSVTVEGGGVPGPGPGPGGPGGPGSGGAGSGGADIEPESPGAGPECESAPFTDTAGHWAEPDICRAATDGIAEGYPDGTFRPDRAVTRGELVAFLVRALGWELGGPRLTFTDADQIGEWLRPALERAVVAGIVEGYDDGSFGPQRPVTRAEAAAIVARALGLGASGDAPTGFADDGDIAAWARGYIAALQATGLVHGRDGNRFEPEASLTRAETVVLALRMLDWLAD